MNNLIILGTGLLLLGVVLLCVSQLLFHTWLKKYEKEWLEDNDEMS